ncbi:MAG: IS630 family transposase [Bdellovibrionia bacterium]
MFQLSIADQTAVALIIKKGKSAREICRAHVLNLRNKGYIISEVADILDITPRTVINITTFYTEGGLDRAINDDPRPGAPPKFDDRFKAKVVAIVCSDPPEGFDRWTLDLLKERIQNSGLGKISRESIRLILQEHDLKPWQEQMWYVPNIDAEYVQRMEDVLDVYERPHNPKRPVICIDEKPIQLLSDCRAEIPMDSGSPKKVDYEYKRNGTANVFCGVEPLAGVYFNTVTETKSGVEFGRFSRKIAERYPDVEKIDLIMDNFSSHTVKSLEIAFGQDKGKEIWNRFEVHYTPKHASWLNQGEIAIGMYARQCLGGGRIGDLETLIKKTNAWNRMANRKRVKIQWNFTKEDAREAFEYGEGINLLNH